jgi:Na+/H+ antiporter NhaD/arsenite permease-like protein
MMLIAVAVFVFAYAVIISDRVNKTMVALVGAGLMVLLPAIDAPDVFYSQATGIDWDVIFLILGMMIIVSILRQTGAFEYTAIWAAKRAGGSPFRIMILLMLVIALASAVLPNVVSVLLIAPVTLLVCDRLAINPTPLLMAEVFASNIGGTATLVGDPPNIIIGARTGLSFNDFLLHMAPIVIIVMLPASPWRRFCSVACPRSMPSGSPTLCRWMRLRPFAIAGCSSSAAPFWRWWPGSRCPRPSIFGRAWWRYWAPASSSWRPSQIGPTTCPASNGTTLLFFVGLFIMVGAPLKTGVIDKLARLAAHAIGGNLLLMTMTILGVSTLVSALIDNVPYVATMTPIVSQLAGAMPPVAPPRTVVVAGAVT